MPSILGESGRHLDLYQHYTHSTKVSQAGLLCLFSLGFIVFFFSKSVFLLRKGEQGKFSL